MAQQNEKLLLHGLPYQPIELENKQALASKMKAESVGIIERNLYIVTKIYPKTSLTDSELVNGLVVSMLPSVVPTYLNALERTTVTGIPGYL